MTHDRDSERSMNDLRRRAEARLRDEAASVKALSADEARVLVQELRTHQIELEMQNEELRRTQQESSVLENLKIGAYLATRSEAKRTLDYVFKLFPALEKLKRRIGGFLSGGEQQMLAIGRALMAQPEILLFDEPLLGLSPLMQATLIHATREIRDEMKISIIVTEQYARPVLPIVDYAFILENGSAVMEGTKEELMDNRDVRAAYFGVEESYSE